MVRACGALIIEKAILTNNVIFILTFYKQLHYFRF